MLAIKKLTTVIVLRWIYCFVSCCLGILRDLLFLCLVGSQNLIHPVAELSDTGVHTRYTGVTTTASPGHYTHQCPDITLLTHQRTTRVTLNRQTVKRVMVRELYREKLRK